MGEGGDGGGGEGGDGGGLEGGGGEGGGGEGGGGEGAGHKSSMIGVNPEKNKLRPSVQQPHIANRTVKELT